jgi:para-aminobenzoate synthetase component 1
MPTSVHHSTPPAQSLPWAEPLDIASGIRDTHWVLLYSGAQADYSGRYSYLAWDVAERVEGRDFSEFEKKYINTGERLDGAWFGYLGYGLKDGLESLTPEQPNWLTLPNLHMLRFHTICEFDHEQKTITLWSDKPGIALPTTREQNKKIPPVEKIRSNMSKADYLKKVSYLVERIRGGDLYQANLTRKFTGEFESPTDNFTLYRKLCEKTPAPYSVFMQLGDTAILSSSPERFLTMDANGHITVRPIKGTAPRNTDEKTDAQSRDTLAASSKDRAENLMIVDLMRNDLARACVPGTVEVKTLFEVTTHPTIHHMSSTIVGEKKPELSAIAVVKNCFPPGSMTGAPKIKAMNICAELEREARGIYSGAIGWFAGDGSCDLSVVIRTLIIQGKTFEFQVGGGIVADSVPEREWQETLDKAKGLSLALDLRKEQLEAL